MNMLTIADTTIRTDAEGRYCLNDLHRASGGEQRHQPRYWLANQQTQDLIAELGDSGNPLSVQKGGPEQGTFVAKELVYAYAMWISPSFHLRVIRAYDAMLAQRDPRAYVESLTRADILRMALDSEQHRLVAEAKVLTLETKIEADAPKVAFARQVEISPGAITTAQAAKIIDTGRTRLMAWMREIHWLNRYNEPYQDKIEAGLLDVKLGQWQHPNHGLRQSVTALITGKGLARLQQLWMSRAHAINGALRPTATHTTQGVHA